MLQRDIRNSLGEFQRVRRQRVLVNRHCWQCRDGREVREGGGVTPRGNQDLRVRFSFSGGCRKANRQREDQVEAKRAAHF